MAQWIRHLTSNQGIPGSSPGRLLIFQLGESSLGLSPGGAGAPTRHSLCLHYDPPTTWGFKTDTQSTFLKWGDYILL